MTQLEHLIQQQVAASVVTTVSRATDKIAEELAREILKDVAFREEMRMLIKRAFATTLTQLATEQTP
jgi:hypothetical protein